MQCLSLRGSPCISQLARAEFRQSQLACDVCAVHCQQRLPSNNAARLCWPGCLPPAKIVRAPSTKSSAAASASRPRQPGPPLQLQKKNGRARSEVVRQRLRQDVAPGDAGQAADGPPGRKLLEAARGLRAQRAVSAWCLSRLASKAASRGLPAETHRPTSASQHAFMECAPQWSAQHCRDRSDQQPPQRARRRKLQPLDSSPGHNQHQRPTVHVRHSSCMDAVRQSNTLRVAPREGACICAARRAGTCSGSRATSRPDSVLTPSVGASCWNCVAPYAVSASARITTRPAPARQPAFSAVSATLRSGPSLMNGPGCRARASQRGGASVQAPGVCMQAPSVQGGTERHQAQQPGMLPRSAAEDGRRPRGCAAALPSGVAKQGAWASAPPRSR